MKFRLDENLGGRTQHLFRAGGHDASTVRDESLQGSPDTRIYEVCCQEHLCLVTLDLDFTNAGQFPAENCAGIVVLRLPMNPSLPLLEKLVSQFLSAISTMSVEQQLLIVEVGRIRIRQRED